MWVETLGFCFATPKKHFLAQNRAIWHSLCQNRCARLGCSLSQEPPPKIAKSLCAEGRESRMCRSETPKPICIKFCMVVDITDVVTHANFGDHRLGFFWGERGVKFPPFPSAFIVVLTTLSHYRARMIVCIWPNSVDSYSLQHYLYARVRTLSRRMPARVISWQS